MEFERYSEIIRSYRVLLHRNVSVPQGTHGLAYVGLLVWVCNVSTHVVFDSDFTVPFMERGECQYAHESYRDDAVKLAAAWLDGAQQDQKQQGSNARQASEQLSSSGIEPSAKRVTFEVSTNSQPSFTASAGARSSFSPIPQEVSHDGGESHSIIRTVLRHLEGPNLGKTSAWSSSQLCPLTQLTISHSRTLCMRSGS